MGKKDPESKAEARPRQRSRKMSELDEMEALMRAAKPPIPPESSVPLVTATHDQQPSPQAQSAQPVEQVLQPYELQQTVPPVVMETPIGEVLPDAQVIDEDQGAQSEAAIVVKPVDSGSNQSEHDDSSEQLGKEKQHRKEDDDAPDERGKEKQPRWQAPDNFIEAPAPITKAETVIALVLDGGSHTTRAGVAGAEEPDFQVLSVSGRRKLTVGGDGMLPDEAFGSDAERASTAYDLARPVHMSAVADWDAAERLWRHALYNVEQGSERVIITTGVVCPKATKQRLVHLCLDALGFEHVHCGVAPILALFGAGYTTGVVVDCGFESTRVVPVYDGFALPHAVLVDTALGGTAVDAHAARLLESKGIAFRNSSMALVAGESCKLEAALTGIGNASKVEAMTVEIPARAVSAASRSAAKAVDLTAEERLSLGEVVFVPQVANRSTESPGLAGVVHKAITACSIDLRRDLYEGIMLVGGASLLPGLPERLDKDLRLLVAESVNAQVTAYANREFAAFAGAAMVASLPDFANNWISKDDANDERALQVRLDQVSYGC